MLYFIFCHMISSTLSSCIKFVLADTKFLLHFPALVDAFFPIWALFNFTLFLMVLDAFKSVEQSQLEFMVTLSVKQDLLSILIMFTMDACNSTEAQCLYV